MPDSAPDSASESAMSASEPQRSGQPSEQPSRQPSEQRFSAAPAPDSTPDPTPDPTPDSVADTAPDLESEIGADGAGGMDGMDGAVAPGAGRPRPVRPAYRPIGGAMRAPKRAIGNGHAAPGVVTAERAARNRLAHLAQVAFINRDFALLWWGQAISSVGDYAWDTALVLFIANKLARNQSWAPLAISGVIIAAALPQIVVGPIAGVFVDRWDKRRTMIVATALQACFAILLVPPVVGLPLPDIGSPHLPTFWALGVIYADVALITICSQFYLPAQFALIKDIAPEEQEDQAQEMTQAIQGLAVVIGPPVAAALVFGAGIGWAMLLNALSFVVAFFAVYAVQAPRAASSLKPGETGHFSREFLDGVRYVLGHSVLRTILIAETLTWLGFGALQTLGYFFITENLHASPALYGVFGAVFGVGAIIGGLGVTFVGRRVGLERILWLALITSGVFVIVMSHLTSFSLTLVAAFFFGVTATAILVTGGPLAIDATQRQYIGRVMATLNPVGKLAAFISVIVSGALVSTALAGMNVTVLGVHFGPVDTIFTGTGLIAVVGGLYARLSLTAAQARSAQDDAS